MKRSMAARSWSTQLLELLVAGAAIERVAQCFLRGAQGRLRFGNIASSRPTAIDHSRAATSRRSSSLLARTSDQKIERSPR